MDASPERYAPMRWAALEDGTKVERFSRKRRWTALEVGGKFSAALVVG
jgi:hypothetical protein